MPQKLPVFKLAEGLKKVNVTVLRDAIYYLVLLSLLVTVDFKHIVDLERVVLMRFRMSGFDVLIYDCKLILILSKNRDIRFKLFIMCVDRILFSFFFYL